ncbi:uncharacterized protein LOC134215335 [Armigeres subalbatus]|uniref:uncharacterized protein LOC134215335 n=1 Tax=Armigeres subalbatus TaxID=124917 RepID=UPI002ED4BFF2
MTVIRQPDNTIKTQWYSKSIASGRMINFHSMHPMNQKLNVVHNFITRVETLSTNLTDSEKQEIITTNLLMNDYPRNLVNRCLNRVKEHQTNNTTTVNNSSNDITYRSLPYIPALTPRITQLIKKNYPDISIIARNDNTIKNLYTRIKDPLPMDHRHNLIYCLQCKDCDGSYIGMTSNLLKTRLSGHRSDQNKLERLLNSGHTHEDDTVKTLREKTALITHCIDYDHRFDLTKPTIIDETQKKTILPFLEMVWIHNQETSINKRTDTEGLNTNYSEIINKIHTLMTRRNTILQSNRQ